MNPIAIVIISGLILMVIERVFPDQDLPKVKGWWKRVIIINFLQLWVVLIGAKTWEVYFQKWSYFSISKTMSAPLAAIICYLIITFVFYWWHRWRHEIDSLWDLFHQVHHSPQRIETITSFYKHPFEIFVNSIIISVISFTLLGISFKALGYVTIFTAYGEYFYHMNIKTPHWIGYFFQRPEMHRVHHQRGKHYKNFSDIPLFDILFGTFENPRTYKGLCGFRPEREEMLSTMLRFRNVNNPRVKEEH